jgi:hypothetical protein
LDRRLDVPHKLSGSGGEEKNSQPPLGIEPQNPDHPYNLSKIKSSTHQKKGLQAI